MTMPDNEERLLRSGAPNMFGNTSEAFRAWLEEMAKKRGFPEVSTKPAFFERTRLPYTLDIGGKPVQQLRQEMDEMRVFRDFWVDNVLHPYFFTLPAPQPLEIIKFKVDDLGLGSNDDRTTDQIYAKAQALGLELCPAEVGPHLSLKWRTLFPSRQTFYIAMRQINSVTFSHAEPEQCIFRLQSFGPKSLSYAMAAGHANPDFRWDLDDVFVFATHKIEN